jgi:hypothetical protein
MGFPCGSCDCDIVPMRCPLPDGATGEPRAHGLFGCLRGCPKRKGSAGIMSAPGGPAVVITAQSRDRQDEALPVGYCVSAMPGPACAACRSKVRGAGAGSLSQGASGIASRPAAIRDNVSLRGSVILVRHALKRDLRRQAIHLLPPAGSRCPGWRWRKIGPGTWDRLSSALPVTAEGFQGSMAMNGEGC